MSAATLTFARSSARSRSIAIDPVLVTAALGLLLLGLVMVTSASITVASSASGDSFVYLKKQLLGVAIGTVAAAVMCVIPTALWQRLALPLLLAAFAMLVIVLIPGIGHTVNGSRRWLPLGVMNFQPSELARVLLLMYLASYVVCKQAELRESAMGFAKPLVVLALASVLLLAEPDMGAATVMMAAGIGMLFLAGVKLRHFFAILAVGGAAIAILAIASPYRLARMTNFWDPWKDAFGSGFQLTQSLIAIGRGEWIGVGLGASVQKLFYLPEAHTDFVFAVLAEELGLIGVIGMLALVGVVVLRVFRVSRLAADASLPYQAFVAASFGIWLALQTIVNVGVNMGLLPTKGLALPFLSYGPSCVVVTLGWLGLVLRIHHEATRSGRAAVPRPTTSTSTKERGT
ncbi:MAG TPA: putative lipid II flippase FtsW [Steroidobacteraceae bacterium]|nr:putative lipid II flippase FtsW [Steroidobacteraceae bacterium]